MSNDVKRIYPNHIYDQTRVQIAQELMNKELQKIFPTIRGDSWKTISDSIKGWIEDPHTYHIDPKEPYRDFWDAFSAIIEGIKLKPSFTKILTANNYRWELQEVEIDELYTTATLDQLLKLSGLSSLEKTNNHSYKEIREYLSDKPEMLSLQEEIIRSYSQDSRQDEYPIIVMEKKAGQKLVFDGNRRALKALLEDENQIKAWVCHANGVEAQDFWVPIYDLIQLVVRFENATQKKQTQEIENIKQTLKLIFNTSKVAEISYQTKLIDSHFRCAKELYDLTLSG